MQNNKYTASFVVAHKGSNGVLIFASAITNVNKKGFLNFDKKYLFRLLKWHP